MKPIGWIALAMAEVSTVAGLLGVTGLDGLDAWSERDGIKRALEQATVGEPAAELVELLGSAGLWCAEVRSTREAVDELREQGHDLIVEVEHPRAGTLELIGCPIRLSATPWSLRYPPPLVGEHTTEVLGEVLSAAELAELRAGGGIG